MGSVCSCTTQQDPLGCSSRGAARTFNAKRRSTGGGGGGASTLQTTPSSSSRNPLQHPSSTMISLCHHPKRPSAARQMGAPSSTRNHSGAPAPTTSGTQQPHAAAEGGIANMLSFTALGGGSNSSAARGGAKTRGNDFVDRILGEDEFTNEDSGKYQPLGSSLFEPSTLLEAPPLHHPSTSVDDGGFLYQQVVLAADITTTSTITTTIVTTAERHWPIPVAEVPLTAVGLTAPELHERDGKPLSLTSAEDDDARRRKSELDPW